MEPYHSHIASVSAPIHFNKHKKVKQKGYLANYRDTIASHDLQIISNHCVHVFQSRGIRHVIVQCFLVVLDYFDTHWSQQAVRPHVRPC